MLLSLLVIHRRCELWSQLDIRFDHYTLNSSNTSNSYSDISDYITEIGPFKDKQTN